MAIGRTNAGGGGTSLNFKVVSGTTQPTSPKENTIWVKTAIDIPYWTTASSTKAPAYVAKKGTVTFWWESATSTEVSGTTAAGFMPIKYKATNPPGNMRLKPINCYQNQDGTEAGWEQMDAYICKGEEWVQFSQKMLRLYNNGDECTATTGGWTTDGFSYGETNLEPTKITKNADRIIIQSIAAGAGVSIVGCNRAVNLDGYSTLVVVHKNVDILSDQGIAADVSISKDMQTDRVAVGFSDASVENKSTLRLDISSLSGNHYIALHGSASRGGEVYEVFLE